MGVPLIGPPMGGYGGLNCADLVIAPDELRGLRNKDTESVPAS